MRKINSYTLLSTIYGQAVNIGGTATSVVAKRVYGLYDDLDAFLSNNIRVNIRNQFNPWVWW